ncbi:MAG: ATP-binding cassette domain-containing protein [Hyphomonadaceae bacterium]|nr:ATP-binding cassette domain-containing protein [Hyphomonadaceae bacterium]MBC6412708.1 ATP-binding cassette domain-containing protein [Hyphomonadaceae bacterium]
MEKVSLRYGRGADVFSDVDLTLKPRSFSFLTGQSGAGKSSLLKLIHLSLRPTRGLISLFSKPVSGLGIRGTQTLKRRIGVMSQDFQLIPHLTVFENTALALRVSGARVEGYRKNTTDLLEWVGLGGKLNHYPLTLSGGEQQRVAIARAVITQPDLLIADEPTGNVDVQMGLRLLQLLRRMNRMGTTILIATHDETLIRKAPADHYHLEDGQLSVRVAL